MGAGCSVNNGDLAYQGFGDVPSFKIVLVGDPEVGKSSIFMRYFLNQFDYSYRTTTSVSIENVVKKLNVPEHIIVSVTIWDLPGREEVDLRKSYYKDVDAAIVVVNIADKESIELAGTWRQDIHNHSVISKKKVEKEGKVSKVVVEYEKADPTQLPVLLLGNKYDIIEEREALKETSEDVEENRTSHSSDVLQEDDNKPKNLILRINSKDGAKETDSRPIQKRRSLDDEKRDAEKEYISGDESPRMKVKMEDERGEERDVTVWKYEEEHEPEVELPEELELLEAAAEQHGFVGSVAVSAKNSDGGVDKAIQALIRHLLERKLKDKALQKMEAVEVRRRKKKKTKPKKVNPDDFQPLEKTDIEEMDKLFMQSNLSLSRIHETSLAYNQSVRQFKRECLNAGLVGSPKSSIEDCIGGLRAALQELSLELMTQDKDGFLQLVVQGEVVYEEEKSEEIKKVMDTFQSEVVVACSAILCDNPSSDADLIRMDAKITNSCSHMWALAEKEQPLSPKDKKKIQHKVDYNRARIRQAHIQCAQSLQDVDGLYKKIKAAMLW
ncbi:uncharacterized protein LOC117296791 isoform X1 [Asterias rubens]|uniref:uncharacterized protein LOC117296791 isoform X1 n=1 Tax=Asterias rubens TaxID=7604 RepID=UPI001455C74B|nr:uncharacterized protein LOC117296791 isoform X1 [Asterias rubens]